MSMPSVFLSWGSYSSNSQPPHQGGLPHRPLAHQDELGLVQGPRGHSAQDILEIPGNDGFRLMILAESPAGWAGDCSRKSNSFRFLSCSISGQGCELIVIEVKCLQVGQLADLRRQGRELIAIEGQVSCRLASWPISGGRVVS